MREGGRGGREVKDKRNEKEGKEMYALLPGCKHTHTHKVALVPYCLYLCFFALFYPATRRLTSSSSSSSFSFLAIVSSSIPPPSISLPQFHPLSLSFSFCHSTSPLPATTPGMPSPTVEPQAAPPPPSHSSLPPSLPYLPLQQRLCDAPDTSQGRHSSKTQALPPPPPSLPPLPPQPAGKTRRTAGVSARMRRRRRRRMRKGGRKGRSGARRGPFLPPSLGSRR
jgi:hypothetical protein